MRFITSMFRIFTTLALILLQACSDIPTSEKNHLYPDLKKQPSSKEKIVKRSLINPNLDPEDRWQKKHFINPYFGRNLSRFGVSKKAYRTAIRNGDSGHAYDAFVAHFAYWSGHYKQGARNVKFGKGRDKEKSLHYLHLASDLGWPEASYILYSCYLTKNFPSYSFEPFQDYSQAKPFPAGDMNYKCMHTNHAWDIMEKGVHHNDFVLAKDNKKARKYLERAAEQGKGFDTSFNMIKNELPELDRLDNRMKMIIAQFRMQSVVKTANDYAKKNNLEPTGYYSRDTDHFLYQEDFHSCGSIYEEYYKKSLLDEKIDCSRGGADPRFCPGRGFQYMRYLLNACMILAPTQDSWSQYFKERVQYFHPYFDRKKTIYGRNLFLEVAKARYHSVGDKVNEQWVEELLVKADKNESELAGSWKNERDNRRERSIQLRKAEERQALARKRHLDEVWEQRMAEKKATDARVRKRNENREVFANMNNFSNTLQNIQNQRMNEIEDAKIRNQKSNATVKTPNKISSLPQSARSGGGTSSNSTVAPASGGSGQVSSKDTNKKTLSNQKKLPSRTKPIFIQEEGLHGWDTQDEACTYAKQYVIRLAEKRCKSEYKGVKATTSDVPEPVNANCQSYRQMEKDGFTHSKGQWKVTGNVIMQCRLPNG